MSVLSKEGHLARITESTLVPLGLVSVIVTIVFIMAGWVAEIQANKNEIVELKSDKHEMWMMLNEINGRLSNIEGAVGVKHRKEN